MTERVLAGDHPLTPNSDLVGDQAGGLANTSHGGCRSKVKRDGERGWWS